MRWCKELNVCHCNPSRAVLSRIAPALSLGLHAVLALFCLCAVRPNLTAQTLVQPVAYEVALVTLEQAGGSGHAEATAVQVARVESPLPRRNPAVAPPQPSKPAAAPKPPNAAKVQPSPAPVPREIAAAPRGADRSASAAATPPSNSASQDKMASGEASDVGQGQGVRVADVGEGATHPLGLPQGLGGGLGRGELQGGIGRVDVLPRILRKVEPCYPAGARASGVTGSVSVRFLVDVQGRVLDPEVVSADPPGVFELSALSAVRKWRFKAATKDGQQVATWVVLPIRFSLER